MSHLPDETMLRWLPPEMHAPLCAAEPQPAVVAAAMARLRAMLAELAPHVPPPVLRQFATSELPTLGTGHSNGSLLCVELAGVSLLLGDLLEAGRSGSEQLSRLINQVLTTLVNEVEHWGGWVLQCSGDGFTAFFDADELGEQHGNLAAAAALAIQERSAALAALPTRNGQQNLDLRMAVHQGRLFLAEVGDARRRVLLTTGQAINQATALMASAAPGELLISNELLQSLSGSQVEQRTSTTYELRGLARRPEPRAAPPFQLFDTEEAPSPAALAALARRVDHLMTYLPFQAPYLDKQLDLLAGAFRPVTVLYANFYAFNRLLTLLAIPALIENDRSLLADTLNIYYAHIQAAIHDHGGSVNKIDMAAFGNRLMAVFGTPRAYEDDPERALLAARALHSASAQAQKEIATLVQAWIADHPGQRGLRSVLSLPMPQRIGVASGTVFAGLIGAATRHEYSLLGGTVSLAARLQTRARDGETLVAGLTQRMVPRTMTLLPMPRLEVIGFAQPIPVFLLQRDDDPGETTEAGLHGRFVGRTNELARLEALALSALHTPQAGQVAVLLGEPGIGKTRVAEELLTRLREQRPEVRIATVASQSYDSSEPYSLVGRVLALLLSLPTGSVTQRATIAHARLAALVPAWLRFLPLLGPLLDVSWSETALTSALPPEQRSERIEELIIAICKALAGERPLLLAIDDLHWSDASSHRVLARLAEECGASPMVLLLIYRQRPQFAEPWRALPWTTVLELGQLSVDERHSLVCDLLSSAELPPELRPALDRSGGSPLFLTEMIQYLLDASLLTRVDGRWVYRETGERVAVSARIEQIIVAQLDLLSAGARRLLEVVATAGGPVEERLLTLVPAAAPLLAEHLGELLKPGLLVPVAHQEQTTYRFRHPLVRDVTYGGLLFARRYALHGAVANALEQLYPVETTRPRAWLARQWQAAARPERAHPYFLAAAQEAQARYANAEALALYEQALATAQGERAQAALHTTMGDIQALTGAYNEARGSYQRSLALLETKAYAVEQAALERMVGTTYEHQGEHEQALRWLFRAAARLTASDEAAAAHERGRIFSEIGWVHFRRGAPETAQEQLEAALELFQQGADPADLSRVLNRLGGVAWQRGELIAAQRYVKRSLAESERTGNLLGQAEALGNLSNLAAWQGEPADSLSYSQRAATLMEQIGSRRRLAMALINVGLSYYYLEQYAEAREQSATAAQLAVEVHDTYHAALAQLNLGRICVELGDWPAAEAALGISLKLTEQLVLPYEQLDTLVALADMALRRDQLVGARQYAAQAHLVAANVELLSNERANLQRLEGKLALASGNYALAAELLHASAERFQQLTNVLEAERTRRVLERLPS